MIYPPLVPGGSRVAGGHGVGALITILRRIYGETVFLGCIAGTYILRSYPIIFSLIFSFISYPLFPSHIPSVNHHLPLPFMTPRNKHSFPTSYFPSFVCHIVVGMGYDTKLISKYECRSNLLIQVMKYVQAMRR